MAKVCQPLAYVPSNYKLAKKINFGTSNPILDGKRWTLNKK